MGRLYDRYLFGSGLRGAGVVEFEELVFLLGGADAHGRSRVLVEEAGDHVRDEGTPFLGAAHGHQVILQ